MAGNSAEYSRVPAVKTSNAKKQAATGVPNKPEKPASFQTSNNSSLTTTSKRSGHLYSCIFKGDQSLAFKKADFFCIFSQNIQKPSANCGFDNSIMGELHSHFTIIIQVSSLLSSFYLI